MNTNQTNGSFWNSFQTLPDSALLGAESAGELSPYIVEEYEAALRTAHDLFAILLALWLGALLGLIGRMTESMPPSASSLLVAICVIGHYLLIPKFFLDGFWEVLRTNRRLVTYWAVLTRYITNRVIYLDLPKSIIADLETYPWSKRVRRVLFRWLSNLEEKVDTLDKLLVEMRERSRIVLDDRIEEYAKTRQQHELYSEAVHLLRLLARTFGLTPPDDSELDREILGQIDTSALPRPTERSRDRI